MGGLGRPFETIQNLILMHKLIRIHGVFLNTTFLVLNWTQNHGSGLCSQSNETCISHGQRLEEGTKSVTPGSWILQHWRSNRAQGLDSYPSLYLLDSKSKNIATFVFQMQVFQSNFQPFFLLMLGRSGSTCTLLGQHNLHYRVCNKPNHMKNPAALWIFYLATSESWRP